MVSLIWGFVFIASGLAVKFFVGKRRFNRVNEAGVEEFSSYGSALANSALEKTLSIGSFIVIIFGVLLVATFFLRG